MVRHRLNYRPSSTNCFAPIFREQGVGGRGPYPTLPYPTLLFFLTFNAFFAITLIMRIFLIFARFQPNIFISY